MVDFRYWKGKCTWAHLNTPDKKYDPLGKWHITFYPDAVALGEIVELKDPKEGVAGILNHLKKDEDGTFINISRPFQRPGKGQMMTFTPPELVDKDGKSISNTRIGHGSDVTVKVEVRTYKNPAGAKGRSLRLWAVRVDNLIPFEQDSYTDEQKNIVDGLTTQPAHLF